MSSPLKQLIPDYKAIEKRIERVVWESLGLYGDMPPEVKKADMSALLAERAVLMPQGVGAALGWEDHVNRPDVPVCPYKVYPCGADFAEMQFLARARVLERCRIAA